MTERYFVDTNIFVYARQQDDNGKSEIARNIIAKIWHLNLGVISTQVLLEYAAVLSKNFSVADELIEKDLKNLLTLHLQVINEQVIDQGLLLLKQY